MSMTRTAHPWKSTAARLAAGLAFLALVGCAQQPKRAVMAPPPPPPQQSVSSGGPYYIFFERDSTAVLPEAKDVVAQVVRDAAQRQPQRIVVSGYSDPKGDPKRNEELAHDRAARVAADLVMAGAPADKVVVAPKGETADMLTPQADRRVRIAFQ